MEGNFESKLESLLLADSSSDLKEFIQYNRLYLDDGDQHMYQYSVSFRTFGNSGRWCTYRGEVRATAEAARQSAAEVAIRDSDLSLMESRHKSIFGKTKSDILKRTAVIGPPSTRKVVDDFDDEIILSTGSLAKHDLLSAKHDLLSPSSLLSTTFGNTEKVASYRETNAVNTNHQKSVAAIDPGSNLVPTNLFDCFDVEMNYKNILQNVLQKALKSSDELTRYETSGPNLRAQFKCKVAIVTSIEPRLETTVAGDWKSTRKLAEQHAAFQSLNDSSIAALRLLAESKPSVVDQVERCGSDNEEMASVEFDDSSSSFVNHKDRLLRYQQHKFRGCIPSDQAIQYQLVAPDHPGMFKSSVTVVLALSDGGGQEKTTFNGISCRTKKQTEQSAAAAAMASLSPATSELAMYAASPLISTTVNYKDILQRWAQKKYRNSLNVDEILKYSSAPCRPGYFKCELAILFAEGLAHSTSGEFTTKKQAEQDAAAAAVRMYADKLDFSVTATIESPRNMALPPNRTLSASSPSIFSSTPAAKTVIADNWNQMDPSKNYKDILQRWAQSKYRGRVSTNDAIVYTSTSTSDSQFMSTVSVLVEEGSRMTFSGSVQRTKKQAEQHASMVALRDYHELRCFY